MPLLPLQHTSLGTRSSNPVPCPKRYGTAPHRSAAAGNIRKCAPLPDFSIISLLRPHLSALAGLILATTLVRAQYDPGKRLNQAIAEATEKRVQVSFEIRQRAEDRTGNLFGRDRDISADFVRFRLGLTVRPLSWMKISALAQDTRAPWYGLPAPGNVRDPLDLQEGYIELFSTRQTGPGLTIGRQMINYGEARLIGSPQWAYTARTWDTARLYHVSKNARLELLFVSTIVPRGDAFNRPVLGDRIWGTYNTFKNVLRKGSLVDTYILRHDQNRPGGFTQPGRLGINFFGTRWLFPLPQQFRIMFEGILQNGKNGLLPHRAGAWVGQIGYKTAFFGLPLDFATEYKFASGTDPRSGRSGTFDQLYPAAHDKFGHVDLIGWKNVHNIKSQATLTARKNWSVILMYNNTWLANVRDGVYTTGSRLVVRSINGTAGRHVGQEFDIYTTYQVLGFTIGGGFGKFLPGEFIRNTTPGAHSHLLYLSTAYSF